MSNKNSTTSKDEFADDDEDLNGEALTEWLRSIPRSGTDADWAEEEDATCRNAQTKQRIDHAKELMRRVEAAGGRFFLTPDLRGAVKFSIKNAGELHQFEQELQEYAFEIRILLAMRPENRVLIVDNPEVQ